jgi:hypothetical protein
MNNKKTKQRCRITADVPRKQKLFVKKQAKIHGVRESKIISNAIDQLMNIAKW